MPRADLFQLLGGSTRWEDALQNLAEYSGEISRDWCREGTTVQFDCTDGRTGYQARRTLHNSGNQFQFTQVGTAGSRSYRNMSVIIRPPRRTEVVRALEEAGARDGSTASFVKDEVYPFEEI